MKDRKSASSKVRLCPIHSKGLLTLSLLVFAESVTFSNAVADIQEINQRHKAFSFFNKPHPTAATTSTSSNQVRNEECSASSATSSTPVLNALTRKNRLISSGGQRSSSTVKYQQSKQSPFSDDGPPDGSLCLPKDHPAFRLCRLMARGGHMSPATTAASSAAEGAATVALGVKVAPYGIPLHLWKVLFQAILTAINVVCWLVPLRSKKISENKLGLSLANAFSGGVFLSLAFGHLIPECIHGFHGVENSVLPDSFPFLMVLAGYLLIFFVEKVAFDAHEILHEMEHGTAEVTAGGDAAVALLSPTSAADDTTVATTPTTTTTTPTPTLNGIHHSAPPPSPSSVVSTSSSTGGSGRGAVILLGALAIHSILEMMALGLSNSFGDSALLSLSIALHQPAESIALLVAFLKSGMPKPQILQYLSVFSCMGPIGVALGMAVKEFSSPMVDSIMLAIVAGTFVYVGATEVIPEEWEDSTYKWTKFGALMSGIVCILVITQYTMSLGIE